MQSKLRRQCFERDDWRCRHCGNRNGLHPHHIVYKSQGGKDELDNLLTLDWICHRAVHENHLVVIVEDGIIKFERKRNWKP